MRHQMLKCINASKLMSCSRQLREKQTHSPQNAYSTDIDDDYRGEDP